VTPLRSALLEPCSCCRIGDAWVHPRPPPCCPASPIPFAPSQQAEHPLMPDGESYSSLANRIASKAGLEQKDLKAQGKKDGSGLVYEFEGEKWALEDGTSYYLHRCTSPSHIHNLPLSARIRLTKRRRPVHPLLPVPSFFHPFCDAPPQPAPGPRALCQVGCSPRVLQRFFRRQEQVAQGRQVGQGGKV